MRPRSLTIVLNTGSGRTAGDGAEDDARTAIEGVLGTGGVPYEIVVPGEGEGIDAAAARAVRQAQASGGAVVAAGGDGTINTVAHAALGTGLPLGVLARGTFNYFARTHGLPLDTAEATRVLLDPDERPVQVGRLKGGGRGQERIFLVNASLGLYPTLLEDREAWKSRFGRNRFVALGAALATLLQRHKRLDLRIAAEGGGTRRLRTTTLFVGNNKLQLEQLGVAEAPRVERGELAVLAVKPVGSLRMLWLAVVGAMGKLGDADDTISFAIGSLEVHVRAPSLKVATDGEVDRLATPFTFEVAETPLRLLVPKGAAPP